MKIVLIGFACCYKTSAGKLLAQKLNYKHIDVDKTVEELAGKRVSEIFAADGETVFRKQECAVLHSVTNTDSAVVSCGGGSVLYKRFDEVTANSAVVWLTAAPDTVYSRLGGEPRPLFDSLNIEQLTAAMDIRARYYEKYADYIVITDNKTSDEVANEIFTLLTDKFANL